MTEMKLKNKGEIYSEALCEYLSKKELQVKKEEQVQYIRIDVSDMKDVANINVYHTGSIVIGGKDSGLKKELQRIKTDFETDPAQFIKEYRHEKACTHKYTIIDEELQGNVKTALLEISDVDKTEKTIDSNKLFSLELKGKGYAVTVTQFKNGTLFLQGKEDRFFENICELIEKKASPHVEEVAIRFISCEEKKVEDIARCLNSDLLEEAEREMKKYTSDELYEFLYEHDKKYAISTCSLMLICSRWGFEFSEYSFMVMPLSKTYEGYLKKLLVHLGITEEDDYKDKNWNFSKVWRKEKYNNFIKEGKDHVSYLQRLESELVFCRHFQMHSDGSSHIEVKDLGEAKDKIKRIFDVLQETFEYFKEYFKK